MNCRSTFLLIAFVATIFIGAGEDANPAPLPEGPGLSAQYPGDAGIDKDPAVLFTEDFESGNLKRWDDKSGDLTIVTEKPHAGTKCVQSEMIHGKNTGGEAKKWFMPGADVVFVRCYVKFSKDYQYLHHFLHLLANSKSNKRSAFGKAGQRPDGTWFTTGMEPWFAWGKNPSPGEISLYTYFMDMEVDKKLIRWTGNFHFPKGPGKGAEAGPDRVIPKLDKWQCWEFMVKVNTPDKADGEQAMWLDGKLIGHFSGIRWRDNADLKVNCFWMQHYGNDDRDPTGGNKKGKQTVWFDDVVVATKYIGPAQ